jgi:hypothetical protein
MKHHNNQLRIIRLNDYHIHFHFKIETYTYFGLLLSNNHQLYHKLMSTVVL